MKAAPLPFRLQAGACASANSPAGCCGVVYSGGMRVGNLEHLFKQQSDFTVLF